MKQYRFVRFNLRKDIFVRIFLLVTLLFLFMPLTLTFNDIFARLAIRLDSYKVIDNLLVPGVMRMVAVILTPLGFAPRINGAYLEVGSDENKQLIEIAWNCIGWQSLLFFILTAWIGFQGDKYTLWSKVKAWFFGLFGTLLVNLLRICVIVMLSYYFGFQAASLFHDYGSTIAVIGWLFVYWWFVFEYILESKTADIVDSF